MTSGRVVHVADGIPDAVYIGRPTKYRPGPYGNPYILRATEPRGATLERFKRHLWNNADLLRLTPALRGKPLACYCRRDGATAPPCHGDVYLALLAACTDKEIEARATQLKPSSDRMAR